MSKQKAVVLLSGGLDSATTLYYAKEKGFDCHCLIFDYGQRHKKEVEQAKKVAKGAGCSAQVIKIALPWKGSSLLDRKEKLPLHLWGQSQTTRNRGVGTVPSTYVPARNTIFLSYAISCAEAIGAKAIFIGANAVDYSGYPDCRPEYYGAFKKVIAKGTKAGLNGGIEVMTPLIKKTKAEIIKLGMRLKVPYHLTWSCYAGGKKPCGVCDSCKFRAKGFAEARAKDLLI